MPPDPCPGPPLHKGGGHPAAPPTLAPVHQQGEQVLVPQLLHLPVPLLHLPDLRRKVDDCDISRSRPNNKIWSANYPEIWIIIVSSTELISFKQSTRSLLLNVTGMIILQQKYHKSLFLSFAPIEKPIWYNMYRPFHKTLPRSSASVNRISVRFYKTGCMLSKLYSLGCSFMRLGLPY